MTDEADYSVEEFAAPETVQPPIGRFWRILAGLTLLIASIYAATGFLIHPVEGTIPYWWYVTYSRTAVYVGIGLVAITALLIILWIALAMRERTTIRIPTRSGLIIVLASIIGVVAFFPSLTERLHHRDTDMIADRMYFLAFQEVIDNENTFILYQCDRLGILCTPRYISRLYLIGLDENPYSLEAQLIPGIPVNSLAIMVDGEVIHTHEARIP
jgi:hypothetical protein